MRIKIWGARGSLPSPSLPSQVETHIADLFQEFFSKGYKRQNDVSRFLSELPRHRLGGYGGNTPCIEVRSDTQQVIIDGGSGLRLLGYEMMAGPAGRGQAPVSGNAGRARWASSQSASEGISGCGSSNALKRSFSPYQR